MDDRTEIDETLKVVFLGDSGSLTSPRGWKDYYFEQIHPAEL